MIDIEATIISQYSSSPTISSLIKNINECIDPRADIELFFQTVFNIDTAKGFGLDVWGRIVNVSRQLKIPATPRNFGFSNGNDSRLTPFNDAPFFVRGDVATETFFLSDDAYRRLILVKALSNITNCTARSLNTLLSNLFDGRGRCYVNEIGEMRIRFTFEFQLTDYERAIITQSNVLPRPAGVSFDILEINVPVFGFSQMSDAAAPFNQSNFYVRA